MKQISFLKFRNWVWQPFKLSKKTVIVRIKRGNQILKQNWSNKKKIQSLFKINVFFKDLNNHFQKLVQQLEKKFNYLWKKLDNFLCLWANVVKQCLKWFKIKNSFIICYQKYQIN